MRFRSGIGGVVFHNFHRDRFFSRKQFQYLLQIQTLPVAYAFLFFSFFPFCFFFGVEFMLHYYLQPQLKKRSLRSTFVCSERQCLKENVSSRRYQSQLCCDTEGVRAKIWMLGGVAQLKWALLSPFLYRLRICSGHIIASSVGQQ